MASCSSTMEAVNICNNPDLLPGFRFHPTDQELIVHYLRQKVTSNSQSPVVSIIAEVDLYKFNPWELPEKAFFGENEWFFFSPRDRKYPNGARPNRAAASGYWKATGTDKPILAAGGSMCLGVKKALVFYSGRPPKGLKTDWVMHEYRLLDNSSPPKLRGSMRLDDWVLCRVRQKSSMPLQSGDQKYNESPEAPHSFDDQFLGKQFEIRTKNYSIEQNPDSKQVFGESSKIHIEPRNVAPSFHVTSREAPSSSTISSLFAQENLGTDQFFSLSPSINNNLQVIESPKRIFSVGGELEDYMQLFPPPPKRLSTASNGVVNSRDEQSPSSNSMQCSFLSEFMV